MGASWKPGSFNHNLFLKQNKKCCYCECEMVLDNPKPGSPPILNRATREHLDRQADGGDSNPDNLAIACHQCNSGRGRVDWLTYKSWVMDNVVVH